MTNPTHWSEPVAKKKKKQVTRKKLTIVKKKDESVTHAVPMRFDPSSGTLVEFIEID